LIDPPTNYTVSRKISPENPGESGKFLMKKVPTNRERQTDELWRFAFVMLPIFFFRLGVLFFFREEVLPMCGMTSSPRTEQSTPWFDHKLGETLVLLSSRRWHKNMTRDTKAEHPPWAHDD